MKSFLFALAITLLIPQQSLAYLTPEEVLFEDEATIVQPPPPNARNARAARAAQEAEYDARAAAEGDDGPLTIGNEDAEEADETEENEDIDDETVHEAAPEEPTAEELRDARILERVKQNQAQDGVMLQAQGAETLHGGAPLAPTGTGTIVAILAVALAIGVTLRLAIRAAIR